MKRLYKSDTDRIFSGVIGGIGEYYNTDPTLLRLAFVIITVLTGFFPCLVAYIIASIIVPERPYHHHKETTGSKVEEKPESTETK